MNKRLIISLVVIFVVGFLIIIILKNNYKHSEFYDKIFTDTSHENSKVVVNYPQIKNDKQEKINKLIKEFAENIATETYGEDYINLSLDVSNYNIVYYKNNLLSIVFEAFGYVSTAAHPNSFFSSINIDLKTASIISFSDLYSINDEVIEIINNNFHEQFLPKKIEEWGIDEDDELYETYKNDLGFTRPNNLQNTIWDKKRFYFSENSIFISAGLPYAIGDHFEIEVEYTELRKFVKIDVEPFA